MPPLPHCILVYGSATERYLVRKMNQIQLDRMRKGKGFIAALDQSGGSTPVALVRYGVSTSQYHDEKEMFEQMHKMRERIITSPAFSSQYILGAILFADTMRRQIEGIPTVQYLWEKKGIVPFLKIDEGMQPMRDGVRLMKPIPELDNLLAEAVGQGVFGTKMRSFISEPNDEGIPQIVDQQFKLAERIAMAGLVPIIEPEIDIHCEDKILAEELLKKALLDALNKIPKDVKLLFKLTIPTVPDHYSVLAESPQVVRVLALSGGYSREDANARLALNHGMVASFSRALTEGLRVSQTDEEFNAALDASVRSIYRASAHKWKQENPD